MNEHQLSAPAPEPVFTAHRIAELLAQPGQTPLLPTPEQRAVIEQPLDGSVLVVAGAGSGKTETMANRVVWLVANGLAVPDRVLGLTFTRKAAGELRERIWNRLEQFSTSLSDAAERGALTEIERDRAAALTRLLQDGLDLPEVSTYNAFASGVLQEFGVVAGIAPGATVIDAATAWRIARETILSSSDPALVSSTLRTSELVRHVLAIDHAVADHLTSFERVEQVVLEFARMSDLPYNEKAASSGATGKHYADVLKALENIAETPLLVRLARAFAAEKARRGLIEFSDQLALATRTLEQAPDAVATLRRRYEAVLLDEVQDTSVGQTRLLSRIFAGGAVMAVGDPHQSIYGWRGASAEGLQSFHADFNGSRSRTAGTTLSLSTSWRNPQAVLTAANAVSAPLASASPVDVSRLMPRPGAAAGQVEWRFPESVHAEREAVAAWLVDARAEHIATHQSPPTAAIIFRNRRHMPAFAASLTAAGVPNRIIGLGGLLSTPEITDVVSVLRCLWYAEAGSELLRVLAGPRFRIGVSDLAGLREAARWFADRDSAQRPLSAEDRAADSVLPDPDRQFTLIDALDRIAHIADPAHRALKHISATGAARLRDAGQMFAALRQGVGNDMGELISSVVIALRLDIELEANESRAHGGGAAALANLDVFADLVSGYLAIDERGTLPSLLEWIERALEDDEVDEHVAAPAPGTVQLITAHGSKGLEWDLVVVPRLVAGEFPATPRKGVGWLRKGQLPDELRGDAGARPVLHWRLASTQKELKDRITDYVTESKERYAEEERRLAYVAITRSADRLLLTGSFWGGQTRARHPSEYLEELQQAEVISGLPDASQYEEDPSEAPELTAQWPLDPLGDRADGVLRAAEALRASLADAEASADGADGADGADAGVDGAATERDIDRTVQLLIAERAASRATGSANGLEAQLPERITASTFHEFVENPVEAERRRLRPVPMRPYRRTRLGNRFHEWVERRSTTAAGTALPLFGYDPELWDPGRAEFDAEQELEPLIAAFEQSRWATLKPIAVEQEVTLPFAGRTLVSKLDAVYDMPQSDGTRRVEIVDWKSGRSPRTDAERSSRFFQLDLYRHAYAQWAGIDVSQIDVSLFYVGEGVELRGEQSRSLNDLERLWEEAAARRTS